MQVIDVTTEGTATTLQNISVMRAEYTVKITFKCDGELLTAVELQKIADSLAKEAIDLNLKEVQTQNWTILPEVAIANIEARVAKAKAKG